MAKLKTVSSAVWIKIQMVMKELLADFLPLYAVWYELHIHEDNVKQIKTRREIQICGLKITLDKEAQNERNKKSGT